jgi:DNA (cytosine-5)-methyltransferase 1
MLETTIFSLTDDRFLSQERLIRKASQQHVRLQDVLVQQDLFYNDLIYEDSHRLRWNGSRGLDLDSLRPTRRCGIPFVSFFSGCGGMDLGFEALGYEHIAAFEINEVFCKTLRRNRPSWKVFGPPNFRGDVSRTQEVCAQLGSLVTAPFPGVFVGGPPCQPFSIAANQRFSMTGENFKRVGFEHELNGNLLFDYIKIIGHFKPLAFLVENVPGLRDVDDGVQLSRAKKQLERLGYAVEDPLVLDAAHYGIPQSRSRLFLIGSRLKKPFRAPKIYNELIGSGSVLNELPTNIPNAEIRMHNAELIARYMRLGYGQRDALGRVDRLNPTVPSKTVIAGGTKGGGRSHLHPEIPRTLSVRECARLQTFPDNFVFEGPTARQFTQVGNAVPPVLAAQIAKALHRSFF